VFAIFINENASTALFPDAIGYLYCVRDLRDNFAFDSASCQGTVDLTSFTLNLKRTLPAFFFMITPLPSIASIISLGFINKIYVLGLYLFIRNKLSNDQPRFYLLVILFLPTLLLYTSTGLREIVILVIQSVLLFTIIERKFLISTLFLIALFAIKIQNAAVLLVLYLGIFLFKSHKSFMHLIFFIVILLFGLILFQEEILFGINYYRLGFLNEIGNVAEAETVFEFQSIIALILNSPLIFLQGLFEPGFSFSGMNAVFFPESILFIILFISGIRYTNYFSESTNCLVFIVFYLGIVLNSIVVENDATFLRYRFSFVYFFLFHLLLIIDKKRTETASDGL